MTQAVIFAEWIRNNQWFPDEKGWSRPVKGKGLSLENKSTEELYQLFIESLTP